MKRTELQKECLKVSKITEKNEYLKTIKKRAEFLINHTTCFHDGRVFTYKLSYQDEPCAECPARSLCGPSLCLLCMFADEFYKLKCEKEKLFYHCVQLVEFKK